MTPGTLYMILSLVIAMVLHELAHGVVARLLGDPTAQRAGRLTLNPLKHIDPMGSIMLPLVLAAGQLAALGRIEFLYGAAKPIPVNAAALRLRGEAHPRQLMAVVAAAGPAMNLSLAILGGLLLYTRLPPVFVVTFIVVNLTIGIFNLLPLPPFDGGRIAVGMLPLRAAAVLARSERLGIAAVLIVLFALPVALGQLGIAFNPFNSVMGRVLPWAVTQVLLVTGHG